ncbi:MAG: TolC family protein [Phycisphaera sp.]|nr:TolC family protein [Phycisphaera sp.]
MRQVVDMPIFRAVVIGVWSVVGLMAVAALTGCSASQYRANADKVASDIITEKQQKALGRTEPFTIDTPADTLRRRLLTTQHLPTSHPASYGTDKLTQPRHWPEADQPKREASANAPIAPWQEGEAVKLSLNEALQVAARNSRDYQTQKESVFIAALQLDEEIDAFRNTYTGMIETLLSTDRGSGETGVDSSTTIGLTRKLKTGASLSTRLVFDLAKLLSMDRDSAYGVFADATITVPLLAGSGRHIVTEPLTQAEREVVYSIWEFERFKRSLAVRVATDYLQVLQRYDQVENAANNYRRLIAQARRQSRLAEAGRSNKLQVDQAAQNELQARDNWIRARETYSSSIDSFKLTLGLPTDSQIELERVELERLAEAAQKRLAGEGEIDLNTQADVAAPGADTPVELAEPKRTGGGPFEMQEDVATKVALDNRLDLRTSQGRVYDAQRAVVVAADALRAGLDITASASAGGRRSAGSASLGNANLRLDQGNYSIGAELDLPWERTSERNAYRRAYISLERETRNLQELEDQIKLDIRGGLRTLLRARESYRIQVVSVKVAEDRVKSTKMFLEAGRPDAQIRDVLEAEDALLNAQNALTAALVGYRVAELEIQRDMGVLQVNEKGLWREFNPNDNQQ